MSSDILIPAAKHSVELRIKNSRFIGTIGPAFSVSAAKQFIRDINQLYSDATHNVPVYQIGAGASIIAHSSDNGEPSGTAGRPALAVLKGSGLGDTVLVITRYFGGTKLGTGGLVKAYSDAARAAINEVPKAKRILVDRCQITSPYKLYEQVLRILSKHDCTVIHEDFSQVVDIQFTIPAGLKEILTFKISEISNGQINVHTLEANKIAILPVKS